MPAFLVFRLYGPLASWGEIAVGEARPSALHPTRSALLGLLGAALGLRRSQADELAALARSVRFAVRVDSMGSPLRDYHTAQVLPPQRGAVRPVREAQLRGGRHELETILSRRDYRCDALYTVAAWTEGAEPAYPLKRLAEALTEPVFPLYLGRKACPPALPLAPEVVEAPTLLAALSQADATARHKKISSVARLCREGPTALYWEEGAVRAGLSAEQTLTRRDDPTPWRSRIFQTRAEHFTPLTEALRKDDEHVPLPDHSGG